MPMQNPRVVFLNFVQLDKQIVMLGNLILDHQQQLQNLYDRQKNAQVEYHAKHLIWYQSVHRVHELESQVESLQKTINAEVVKLTLITQYKEYDGLQKKIVELRATQLAIEEKLIDAWAERDLQDTYFKQYEGDYNNNNALDIVEIQKEKKILDQLLIEVENLRGIYNTLRPLVSEKLLHWYDRMRMQLTEPVVLAVQNMCQGCYNQIPDKDMMRLRRGAFIVCKSCYRCMYTSDVSVDAQQFVDEIQQ